MKRVFSMLWSGIKTYFRLLFRINWKLSLPIGLLTVLIIAYGCAFIVGEADDLPFNTYSDGYRFGQLTHFGMEGNPLIKTGELTLMHGNNSSAGQIIAHGKTIFDNPGRLSASRSVHDEYRPLVGEYVVIKFRQIKVQLSHFNGDTDYRVEEIVRPDPSLAPATCGETGNTSSGSRGDADSVGYLVKVSNKGNFIASNEAIMQIGNASGTFLAYSISDDAIAECARNFVKAGLPVKLHYRSVMVRDPLSADTNLNIIGLTRLAVK